MNHLARDILAGSALLDPHPGYIQPLPGDAPRRLVTKVDKAD